MSRHEGVSCDSCLKTNFEGKRFKCLICYDYDLCESCHTGQAATSRHLTSHAMQCILTRSEFDLYYGGETISPETPPSFVCPFCAKLGFTENLLHEHVTKEHENQHTEVVCPICAALPSGDPNLVTEDLAHHLSMEHRNSRDADDPAGSRHIRRMFYPGRGMRTRNHRNMHFSGGPLGTSAIPSSTANNNNVSSSSIRESMDPIAELLSQLSGVRRSAQQFQQNVTTASQLQELQTQLQLERQRAVEIRQQLERFPTKPQSSNSASQNVHPSGGAVSTSSRATTSNKKSSSNPSLADDEDSRFLLLSLDDIDLSDGEQERQNQDDADASLFVQELILSLLSSERASTDKNERLKPSMSKSVAVDCPLSSSTYATAEPGSCSDANPSVANDPIPSNSASRNLASISNTPDSASSNFYDDPGNSQPLNSTATRVDFFSNDQGGDRSVDSRAVSTSVMEPGAGEQLQETVGQWQYEEMLNDSEDDKPPSPPPLQQQRHGIRLQGRVYAAGPVGLGAGSAMADYSREDVATVSVNKSIH